jgi:hypothetical protein
MVERSTQVASLWRGRHQEKGLRPAKFLDVEEVVFF